LRLQIIGEKALAGSPLRQFVVPAAVVTIAVDCEELTSVRFEATPT
jgi:hypothetical protein